MKECSNCNGTGEVRMAHGAEDETEECPDCKGSGQLDDQGFSPEYELLPTDGF